MIARNVDFLFDGVEYGERSAISAFDLGSLRSKRASSCGGIDNLVSREGREG